MRERLAVARSAGRDMDTCAAAAFGNSLGNLLLRGIDNRDLLSLRRAKFTLARHLSQHGHMSIIPAARIARDVLTYLADERCLFCLGQQFIRQESSVRACPTCEGSGLAGQLPMHWQKYHLLVLRVAQASMGKALAQARAAAMPG